MPSINEEDSRRESHRLKANKSVAAGATEALAKDAVTRDANASMMPPDRPAPIFRRQSLN